MRSVKKKKSQFPSRAFKKDWELGGFFPLAAYYVNGSFCHKILMIVRAEGKKYLLTANKDG